MLTSHINRLQLERLAADDPRARVAPVLRVHVGACDECRTRLRALVAARARFLNAHPARVFARDALARAERFGPNLKPPWWVAPPVVRSAVGALALALAVAAWFAHGAAASWSRFNAGTEFQVLAKRGELESRVRDGDTLGRGDRLAFEYSLPDPRHFMLLGIDDTGTIRRYVPDAGEDATNVVLDATPRGRLAAEIDLGVQSGDERLYALFGSQPISELAARQAIATAVGSAWARAGGLTNTPRPSLGVQWASVWVRKHAD